MDDIFVALLQPVSTTRLYLAVCEDANQAVLLERLVHWQARAAVGLGTGVCQVLDNGWWIGATLDELASDSGLSVPACKKAIDRLIARKWLSRRMAVRDQQLISHWRVSESAAHELLRSRGVLLAITPLEMRALSSSSRARAGVYADILESISLGSLESVNDSKRSALVTESLKTDSESSDLLGSTLLNSKVEIYSDSVAGTVSLSSAQEKNKTRKALDRARAKTIDSESDSKTRARDPVFDAVAQHLFAIDPHDIKRQGGHIAIIANWLAGKIDHFRRGKTTCDLGGFNAPPVKPEHIDQRMREFVGWYRAKFGASAALPLSPEKFTLHWRAFKAAWLEDYNRKMAQHRRALSPPPAPSWQPSADDLDAEFRQLAENRTAPEVGQGLDKTG